MSSLAVVSVVTRDMAASIRFYAELGLELEDGGPQDPHVSFAGDGVKLMLDTEDLIKQIDPDWTRPSGGHAMALGFACDTPAKVDELFSQLREACAQEKAQPWDAFWGQRYASVFDPDGNQIDLFCDL